MKRRETVEQVPLGWRLLRKGTLIRPGDKTLCSDCPRRWIFTGFTIHHAQRVGGPTDCDGNIAIYIRRAATRRRKAK